MVFGQPQRCSVLVKKRLLWSTLQAMIYTAVGPQIPDAWSQQLVQQLQTTSGDGRAQSALKVTIGRDALPLGQKIGSRSPVKSLLWSKNLSLTAIRKITQKLVDCSGKNPKKQKADLTKHFQQGQIWWYCACKFIWSQYDYPCFFQ